MPYLSFNNVKVSSLATAVPSHIQYIANNDRECNERQIRLYIKQIGIVSRHISITEQTCTDIGYVAAQQALKNINLSPTDLDGVIFASQTPDFNPGTGNAFIIHNRLGLRTDTIAFDISLGCSGFPYALSVGASFLQQKSINKLLILIGSTRWSAYPNKEALLSDTRFLIGESVSALILEKTPQPMNLTTIALYSDGSGYRYLYDPFVGSRNYWRKCNRAIIQGSIEVEAGAYMDGVAITNFATTTVVDSIKSYIQHTNIPLDSYDGLILHQANKQIIKTISRRLEIDDKKVPISLDRYANTDGASVTTTISDAYHQDTRDCIKLLTCAFGIGLSWGIANITISPKNISPIILVEDQRFQEGFIQSI